VQKYYGGIVVERGAKNVPYKEPRPSRPSRPPLPPENGLWNFLVAKIIFRRVFLNKIFGYAFKNISWGIFEYPATGYWWG
jgi:hypothetical protein